MKAIFSLSVALSLDEELEYVSLDLGHWKKDKDSKGRLEGGGVGEILGAPVETVLFQF